MKSYYITMDSFGSECPMNWEEIAAYLNDKIDELVAATPVDEYGSVSDSDEIELQEKIMKLWDDYCSGDIPDAPEPSIAE